jgi:RNA processing factor Prp31
MRSKMHWLIPLVTMLAGAALAMALIGALVGQLDAPMQGGAGVAAPSR